MLMFVCLFGRAVQVCLEQSIFFIPGQRAIRDHSENNQIIKNRVTQLEPKILRLVYIFIEQKLTFMFPVLFLIVDIVIIVS